MKAVLSVRKTWRDAMQLDAPPERVFPLLCPVREYDWIEDWQCEVLYSVSGVAEDGCIFRTHFPSDGPMTWIVTRYEPPRRIEFACFVAGSHTMRLKLELQPQNAGTALTWIREFTATDPAGNGCVENHTDADHRRMMSRLDRMLKHYLRSGTMLHLAAEEGQPVR